MTASPVLALAQSSRLQLPDLVGMGYPMYNGKIVESHSGSAVTFAIKTNSGADPSPTDMVHIGFTEAAGEYVERTLSAATSVTVASGSTLGVGDANRFEVAIVAIENGGSVELGVASRSNYTVADTTTSRGLYLDERYPQNVLAEGNGAADSAGTLYGASARSNVQARILGRAEYDAGLATAGIWSVSPNRITLERPGLRPTNLQSAFYAHKNNVSQPGLTHLSYTKLTWNVCRFNVGGHFDIANGWWRPPAGLVELSAAGWWQANVANSPANSVLKIWKNGQATEISAGEGWAPAGFANTAGACIPRTIDLANGTDTYSIWAYSTTASGGNDAVMDGNPAHTWFTGNIVG